jgi:hemerythrin-like domain-containing protein
MDVVQLIKREHAKASSLFEKLAETSDSALKTRERLFDQLKNELEAHQRAMQGVVYPILMQHPETQNLLPQLREQNERVGMLDELERTPKDDENFLKKVKEFRRNIEQHLRNEERQLLPMIKKVIGQDEAEEIARRIAAETRDEIHKAEQRSQDATLSAADAATETTASAAVMGPMQLAEIGQQMMRAAQTFLQTNRQAADDLQTLLQAPLGAARATQELQQVWIGCWQRIAAANMRSVQELPRCSGVQQAAALQGALMRENLNGWLESSAETMRIAQDVLTEARAKLEQRVGHDR